MKKFVSILIAAFLCVPFLSACTTASNEVLTVWCAKDDEAMIKKMVAEFIKEKKPDIKDIVVVVSEDDKVEEKIVGSADKTPSAPSEIADVMCVLHNQLGTLVSKNAFLEITDQKYIDSISKNTTPSINAGKSNEKQYGFPSSFETQVLFYDKSLISEEAVKSLEGILASEVAGGFSFGMNFEDSYYTAGWFFTYGCKLFGDLGEDETFCDFDSENGVAAMTYLINNRKKFGNFDVGNPERIDAAEMFKEKKLGAYIGGPWHAEVITKALSGNYGCTKLPSIDGRDMKSFAGFKLYCVNANTKNKTVALDLAEWLTNEANQKNRFDSRNLNPVAKSLANDEDVKVSGTAKAVLAQGPFAIAMPSIPKMGNFWDPKTTRDFIFDCYNGKIAISDLQTKLDELVADILK